MFFSYSDHFERDFAPMPSRTNAWEHFHFWLSNKLGSDEFRIEGEWKSDIARAICGERIVGAAYGGSRKSKLIRICLAVGFALMAIATIFALLAVCYFDFRVIVMHAAKTIFPIIFNSVPISVAIYTTAGLALVVKSFLFHCIRKTSKEPRLLVTDFTRESIDPPPSTKALEFVSGKYHFS